jgi:hypothetical protein
MFDWNGDTFIHTSGTGTGDGPIVEFRNKISLYSVNILTRHDCCTEPRYQNVCLFVDEIEVACTPDNWTIGYRQWIHFQVRYYHNNYYFNYYLNST